MKNTLRLLLVSLCAVGLSAQVPEVSDKHVAAWIKAKRELARAEKAIVGDCIAGYRPQFDPQSVTFACVRPPEAPPVPAKEPAAEKSEAK